MLTKIKTILTENIFPNITNPNFWAVIGFGVIALMITWSSFKIINTNFELEKKITIREKENEILALEIENLKLKNEFLKTNTYLELSARQLFNKAKPGEKLIIVPKDVALAHIPSEISQKINEQNNSDDLKNISNFEAWKRFFLSNN